jgi:hypothetical protein
MSTELSKQIAKYMEDGNNELNNSKSKKESIKITTRDKPKSSTKAYKSKKSTKTTKSKTTMKESKSEKSKKSIKSKK